MWLGACCGRGQGSETEREGAEHCVGLAHYSVLLHRTLKASTAESTWSGAGPDRLHLPNNNQTAQPKTGTGNRKRRSDGDIGTCRTYFRKAHIKPTSLRWICCVSQSRLGTAEKTLLGRPGEAQRRCSACCTSKRPPVRRDSCTRPG